MEWKPIESAPKDGTVLLLYGNLIGPGLTTEHPQGPRRVVGGWDDIDGAWALVSNPWDGPFFQPTHWAALLKAPTD